MGKAKMVSKSIGRGGKSGGRGKLTFGRAAGKNTTQIRSTVARGTISGFGGKSAVVSKFTSTSKTVFKITKSTTPSGKVGKLHIYGGPGSGNFAHIPSAGRGGSRPDTRLQRCLDTVKSEWGAGEKDEDYQYHLDQCRKQHRGDREVLRKKKLGCKEKFNKKRMKDESAANKRIFQDHCKGTNVDRSPRCKQASLEYRAWQKQYIKDEAAQMDRECYEGYKTYLKSEGGGKKIKRVNRRVSPNRNPRIPQGNNYHPSVGWY